MTLDEAMERDHAVCVHADGTVTEAPERVYAPGLDMDSLPDEEGSILPGHEAAGTDEPARGERS